MMAYEILGIPITATYEEARQAFKRHAQACHPDKGGNPVDYDRYRKALHDFKRLTKCPECGGAGHIKKKQGVAVTRLKCPKCWGLPRKE